MRKVTLLLLVSILFNSCSKPEKNAPSSPNQPNDPTTPNQPIVIGNHNVILLHYNSENSTDSIFTNTSNNQVDKISFNGGVYDGIEWNYDYSSNKIIRSRLIDGLIRYDTISLNSNGTIDSISGYFISGWVKYSYQVGSNPLSVHYANGNSPLKEQYFYSGANLDSIDHRIIGTNVPDFAIKFDYTSTAGNSTLHSQHQSIKKMYDLGLSDRKASKDDSKRKILMGIIYSNQLPSKATYYSGLQPVEVYNITYDLNAQGDVTIIYLNNKKHLTITY